MEVINPQLTDYIRQACASGMSHEQIRQELLKGGWQEGDINAAIVAAAPSVQQAVPVTPLPSQGGHLTQEEVQRIEEEERVRAEARARYVQPQPPQQPEKPKKKRHPVAKFFLVSFFIILVLAVLGSVLDDQQPQESTYPINADVKQNTTEVVVRNNDSFDWSACELVLNLSSLSYYQAFINELPAGKSVTIALIDFIKLDSTKRFNPFAESVANLSIRCQTPQGKGFWTFGSKL